MFDTATEQDTAREFAHSCRIVSGGGDARRCRGRDGMCVDVVGLGLSPWAPGPPPAVLQATSALPA